MSKYQEVLEFLMENGVQLNKEQMDNLKDILNEGTVRKVQGKKEIGIAVNGKEGRNFDTDPYIKVYHGPNSKSSKDIARISLIKLNYVIHNEDSDQKEWRLSPNEQEELNEIMQETRKDGLTVWEKILKDIADQTNKPLSEIKKMFPDGCPDFTKLPRKKK